MTRLIWKMHTSTNTGSGLFPWGSRGEISRAIRFRFCIITHSIEFNYFIVKILEDKWSPQYIYLHFPSGVITYFQIILKRNCVLGHVQSRVWNKRALSAQCFHCYVAECILCEKLVQAFYFQVPIPISSGFQRLLLDFSRSDSEAI